MGIHIGQNRYWSSTYEGVSTRMIEPSIYYFGKDKSGKYIFTLTTYNLKEYVEVESKEHYEITSKLCSKNQLSADENGRPILIDRVITISEDDRLVERRVLHKATDEDYAKYSRQVRMNIDKEHSQAILDYIDQYNLEVSNTVNQAGFPQEVVYPEYKLP